jgi:hypothetical protein
MGAIGSLLMLAILGLGALFLYQRTLGSRAA